MPTPPLQTWLTQLGLAKETTWGTAVAPTTADQFIPVLNPKLSDEIEPIYDRGLRSRASLDQAWYQGFRMQHYTFESQFYPDVCGNWLMGMFGADGWSSGTTHPFTVLNTALPPSYTIQDFYGIGGSNTRSMAGCYFDSITMSGTNTGPLKASVSLIGKSTALVAKPTAVYTSAAPFLTWQNAVTLNSVANLKLIAFDITFKRPVEPIFAVGVQDPSASNAGQLEVAGKLTFAPTDDTEYLLYITTAQAAFPMTFLFTSGANTLTIQMTKVQFEKPTTLDRGTPYLKVLASFRAIDNATDGGAAKVTLVGGKSGAAY